MAKSKHKHLWVKGECGWSGDQAWYCIYPSLAKAKAEEEDERLYMFCAKIFEKFTGFSCEPGEIHKVRITVEKVLCTPQSYCLQ